MFSYIFRKLKIIITDDFTSNYYVIVIFTYNQCLAKKIGYTNY